jgi:hypothetical protein
MGLTGKAKEDFEKWLIEKEDESTFYTALLLELDYNNGEIPFEMAYGVYVDFFDSVGIHLMSYNLKGDKNRYCSEIELAKDRAFFSKHYKDTRAEARQKAIEKASEIYNDTFK